MSVSYPSIFANIRTGVNLQMNIMCMYNRVLYIQCDSHVIISLIQLWPMNWDCVCYTFVRVLKWKWSSISATCTIYMYNCTCILSTKTLLVPGASVSFHQRVLQHNTHSASRHWLNQDTTFQTLHLKKQYNTMNYLIFPP